MAGSDERRPRELNGVVAARGAAGGYVVSSGCPPGKPGRLQRPAGSNSLVSLIGEGAARRIEEGGAPSGETACGVAPVASAFRNVVRLWCGASRNREFTRDSTFGDAVGTQRAEARRRLPDRPIALVVPEFTEYHSYPLSRHLDARTFDLRGRRIMSIQPRSRCGR
jgi:hypothetical protein